MKASVLRNLSEKELSAHLDEVYEEYFKLRFNKASGQHKNYARFREVRRDIARIRTVMRERELAEGI